VKVWVDLANSPHVPLFVPIVKRLRAEGADVVVSARDHAQTLPLARAAFPEVTVVGGASPPGKLRKGLAIAARARALRAFARSEKPDVAISHGSYAQIVAARTAGVPAVTMMDYEYQPANHVSFRLARRVVVPASFPEAALRRHGARPERVVRYDGFKEQLYLAGVKARPALLAELGLDPERPTAVMRPPPEGALYHGAGTSRFDQVLVHVLGKGAEVVLLPRDDLQAARYATRGATVPPAVVDGPTLLATADLVVGGGGTMTREAALLGTPTYTVFAARLAAVDEELIRTGRLTDLRGAGTPRVARRPTLEATNDHEAAQRIMSTILGSVEEAGISVRRPSASRPR
jgi:predicted glycosyltransferase